ncbi:nicotinate-nucleotide--dimethylbenzimidazole phosphoribosyltransferase [Micromonospora pisi]|uniref:Nicotinate-nucleotide--dimethylbenzimidazole phosphoribosyltransferase n=2 Tax=Micromonospora pisi TaxID=589240 RepID=A0A495JGI3_9ACTN|nr:nicotinate-nucleotide--dimethylbenzimidazole phosphoribosyltransferase [Micromonospora pisi]RKR87881.1 nicotinate-nucleotide--dimethylbenzimidazole phosphoribosyltransferase [Micromonospora pisi]
MLEALIATIRPLDTEAMEAARALHSRLTKPAGSLGELEELSVRLCGLAGSCPPPLPGPAAVAIFAGDHGVHDQGVTPWSREVTAQMVGNFLAGGAVVNAFARQTGASVTVVDVGVATPLPDLGTAPTATATGSAVATTYDERTGLDDLVAPDALVDLDGPAGPAPTGGPTTPVTVFDERTALESLTSPDALVDLDGPATASPVAGVAPTPVPSAAVPGPRVAGGNGTADGHPVDVPALVRARVRPGTRDMTVEPALTRDEARAAIEVGIRTADQLIDAGAGILLTGDMGIANTTAAAALIAVHTGTASAEVTGRGTGVDDFTYARKVAVVSAALARHRPDPADPLGVLAALGGLEHAALTGFILGAAARRTPVLLDGVSAVAAALVAAAFAPDATGAMIAGHRSAEPGATVGLRQLGLEPLIDLGLRLGEGTGALLAFPVVAGAARVLHEVATFDAAGVSEK